MRYILLYNPISGKGRFKDKIPCIKKYFNDKSLSLDIYESRFAKDLETKAEHLDDKYDVVIIAGGDGTVNEVLNGIMKRTKKPKLAIIPSGTANDVASILGMKKNIKKTLDIITTTNPIAMDVNQLNDRYFIYTTAAGVLTKVSYDISRRSLKRYGYFAYLMEGFKDMFKKYRMPMKITHDKGVTEGNFMLVLGLTSTRVGGFTLRRFSDAHINDGKFDLRLLNSNRFFRIAKLALFFLTAGLYRSKGDFHLSSTYFKIETTEDVTWNTDGEKSMCGSIEIKVLNEAIEVYTSDKVKKKHFI